MCVRFVYFQGIIAGGGSASPVFWVVFPLFFHMGVVSGKSVLVNRNRPRMNKLRRILTGRTGLRDVQETILLVPL